LKHAIIHIADIHYKDNNPEGAKSIIKALIKDLDKEVKGMPEHNISIAITGDIVQSGDDITSYQAFITELDNNLADIGINKNNRIIVPGNHDINRSTLNDELESHLIFHREETKDETRFNNAITEQKFILDNFENYEIFVSEFAKYDQDFSPLGWGFHIDNNVGVYCLNSALCSFAGLNDVKDEGNLAIYTRGLVEWCNKKTTETNILLMHHPLDHLNTWSRKELETIIEEHFCLCLFGHNHRSAIYHNRPTQDTLMCSAPPLFSSKEDTLAYTIVIIENNEPSQIKYKEYSNGSFFPSPHLSRTDDGIVKLNSQYLHSMEQLEESLKNKLQSFKGQPCFFVKPKLSEVREFNDNGCRMDELIDSPTDSLIIAPPQFGLSCLALYMRFQAFKRRKSLWIYIDAKHIKARNVLNHIREEVNRYSTGNMEVESILIDGWDNSAIDHSNMIKEIDANYPDASLILLSSKAECLNPKFHVSSIGKNVDVFHLQALNRNSIRTLVNNYNKDKYVGDEDEITSHLATNLEAINIHRTPLNCLTLLRVLEGSYADKVINRTKLMKAILFVIFTDSNSFSYSSDNPEVEECTYVLGQFCKQLIIDATGSFDALGFTGELKKICKEKMISLDVETMVDILIENSILIRYGNFLEFKHTFWIYYFAAEYMTHDADFKNYILNNQKYVNFPEIVEFYAGVDGKREDAIEILLNDLSTLTERVDNKIGIDGSFNPLSDFLWDPSNSFIEKTRKEIVAKVESSNLPDEIKDTHADDRYNSKAPYDQSINKFLEEFAVISLLQSIKAISRALRNSMFISPKMKKESAKAIFDGWEQISKVMFLISPLLAQKGIASHDGLSMVLSTGFSDDLETRFKQILIANPRNVVLLLKDDLSSKKIGPMLYDILENSDSEIQRHLVAIFLIQERPPEWSNFLLGHINLLHPSSYYLGNILSWLRNEIELGFIDKSEEGTLKILAGAIINKKRYFNKDSKRDIPPNMTLNKGNMLPRDKLLSTPKDAPSVKPRRRR
jgi:hypothetical protein